MPRPGRTLAPLLVAASVCGCGTPTTTAPPGPSSPPIQSPATPAFTLAGFVDDALSRKGVKGASVAISTGPNANRSAVTDGNGYYAITSLISDTFTVHATATGYIDTDKTVTLSSNTEVDFSLQQLPPSCDASLWNHVHDVKRLTVMTACQTVTGVVVESHANDDGDIDMDLAVDQQYKNLLNQGNITKLNGNLHIEAICQAPVHPDVPDALRSCANFKGTVPIPANGMYVQVTGVYLKDNDHGWMEIHPISVLSILR
jgi:hypothetical protein